MWFEVRPDVGDEIAPQGSQRFDLYYAPGIINVAGTAAPLTYKIEHTNAKLEIRIETTPYENNSWCHVQPQSEGYCTAGGLDITFRRW